MSLSEGTILHFRDISAAIAEYMCKKVAYHASFGHDEIGNVWYVRVMDKRVLADKKVC